jgi:hypothetical protein
MTIQVATLCDAATDYGGKLNILGTFDTIVARQFPVFHPQCTIALRLVFDRNEEATHQIVLNFIDDDGRSIMPSIEMGVDVRMPPDSLHVARNFIIHIQQMKFDRAGHYAIGVMMDNALLTSMPLQVRLVTQPQT